MRWTRFLGLSFIVSGLSRERDLNCRKRSRAAIRVRRLVADRPLP